MGGPFFILVITKNENEFVWLVTASAATPEALRNLPSHHDQIVMRLPHALYPSSATEERQIVNAHTGEYERATINEITHV